MRTLNLLPALFFLLPLSAGAAGGTKSITINEAHVSNAPSWLTRRMLQKVVDRIQSKLEWDIRKVQVTFYTDQGAFEKLHGFGPTVLAFARKQDNSIHVGPKVNATNFAPVFGHELVHIVVFQKFKEAIPKWLDEGMANYVARWGNVDYRWLANEPSRDVTTMVHPFAHGSSDSSDSSGSEGPRYHYMASTALMEMMASKCDVYDLLELAMQKKLENYLSTYCGIDDINAAFQAWVKKKARR